jgi:hypothetical protein
MHIPVRQESAAKPTLFAKDVENPWRGFFKNLLAG